MTSPTDGQKCEGIENFGFENSFIKSDKYTNWTHGVAVIKNFEILNMSMTVVSISRDYIHLQKIHVINMVLEPSYKCKGYQSIAEIYHR